MSQSPPTDPSLRPPPPAYRWVVLVVISLAMFGNYYVYDAISPIADLLKEQLGFSDSNIGLLNAIYSFPNILMVLVGGILIDRIGVKKATLLFGVLCLVGAAVTAASGSLAVMASGRLIFGLGAESLIVSVTTAIAKWFRGRELSFAFGVNLRHDAVHQAGRRDAVRGRRDHLLGDGGARPQGVPPRRGG